MIVWLLQQSLPVNDEQSQEFLGCLRDGAQKLDMPYSSWPGYEAVIHDSSGVVLHAGFEERHLNSYINLATCQGVGEVSIKRGKVLVLLAYLHSRFKANGMELQLCAEENGSSLIEWSSVDDLINRLSVLGFCKETLWQYAEALGLGDQRLDLSLANIGPDAGFYF